MIADQLSRGVELSTEWSLSPKDFQQIRDLNPCLEVDQFSTRLNHKLPTFISPCEDSKATAVDALSTPWHQWNHLYLFPPTTLIPKALAKLSSSPFKSAVLLTPETPTRPWYMSLSLRKVPSVLLEVFLQQEVVGKLVIKPQPSLIRAWMLSKHHFAENIHSAQKAPS